MADNRFMMTVTPAWADNAAAGNSVRLPQFKLSDVRIRESVVEKLQELHVASVTFDALVEHVLPHVDPYNLDLEILRVAKGNGLLWSPDMHSLVLLTGMPSLRSHSVIRLTRPGQTKKFLAAQRRGAEWYRADTTASVMVYPEALAGRVSSFNVTPGVMTISPVVVLHRAMFDFHRDLMEQGVDSIHE